MTKARVQPYIMIGGQRVGVKYNDDPEGESCKWVKYDDVMKETVRLQDENQYLRDAVREISGKVEAAHANVVYHREALSQVKPDAQGLDETVSVVERMPDGTYKDVGIFSAFLRPKV